jgi:hypothetical protein
MRFPGNRGLKAAAVFVVVPSCGRRDARWVWITRNAGYPIRHRRATGSERALDIATLGGVG